MAPLRDPLLLARYQSALANWNVTGYVDWNDTARDWIKHHLRSLKLRDVAQLMHQFVLAGGEVDQVPERRPEWNDRDFHFDLRLPLEGRLRYIETLLLDDDPDDPIIYVVSIHDA